MFFFLRGALEQGEAPEPHCVFSSTSPSYTQAKVSSPAPDY